MKNFWKGSKLKIQTSVKSYSDAGYIGRIPVRNLWLLMLYASDLFQHLGRARIDIEDNPEDIPDLIAEILTHIVERRLKRNLCHGYQPKASDLNRVRGRIDVLRTERRRLLDQGKVACRYDELSNDRPRNRFVRSALENLSKIVRNPQLRIKCRSMASAFKQMGVVGEKPTRSEMSVDRLGRHDIEDKQMVAAAELSFNLALPTELSGTRELYLPDREIRWIRLLFEKAVAGFYKVVLTSKGWKVEAGKYYNWQIDSKTSGIEEILPKMKTDIFLEHAADKHRIIIDTKFNSIFTRGRYREESLRSAYIYQIYAYLRSQEHDNDPLSKCSSGILLHPAIDHIVDEFVIIQGHKIKFATVDLGDNATVIRKQLLHIIDIFDDNEN